MCPSFLQLLGGIVVHFLIVHFLIEAISMLKALAAMIFT